MQDKFHSLTRIGWFSLGGQYNGAESRRRIARGENLSGPVVKGQGEDSHAIQPLDAQVSSIASIAGTSPGS